MELNGKVCVVTGAAGGIGRAIARRFHAAGAEVLVTDLDAARVAAVAAELNTLRPGSAVSIGGSVAREPDVVEHLELARSALGPVDLYWANAGVASGTDLETPDDVWDLAWGVNVKAHYYAARHLVPDWVARGEGYFCSTASAAGLLAQIGSAPYTMTKHAAVAFAEWMSITYGDRGVRVSCLCPQGVNTDMLNGGEGGVDSRGADAVRAGGAVLEPEDVAEACLATVTAERFLVLPHPEVLTYWQRKTSDIDRWLGGMRRLQARLGSG